jgi:hypothetical protein
MLEMLRRSEKMRRMRFSIVLLILTLVGPSLSGGYPAAAQSSHQGVTASAECVDVSQVDEGSIEVTIDNESGMPIAVSYVESFITGQAFNPEWTMSDPGKTRTRTVEDGDRLTIDVTWNQVRMEGELGAALVVTSAGILLPMCDGREVGLNRPLGDGPVNDEELARIAAETIGALEMWRAYPALYALLHPDAQELIPFETVACWYADQFGLPSEWKQTAFAITVLDVTFAGWTWSVTGDEYVDAAEVTYEQDIGGMGQTGTFENIMHLVSEDGQYRWFFGGDLATIESMPTDCDLGR